MKNFSAKKNLVAPILLLFILILFSNTSIANADASCIQEVGDVTGAVSGNCTVNDVSTACQAAGFTGSACANQNDQAVLQVLGTNPLGTQGSAANQAAQKAGTAPSICTVNVLSWSAFFTPSCWGPLLSAVIAGALVSIASWTLTVSGLLFNWVLAETVLQFGQLINCGTTVTANCGTGLITGINTAWSVFRDISNIVIIGMFTFIAIATILSNPDYGAKKMISKVLIVAILINFSLLFTKIIIDVSNFTASQFATAVGATNAGAPISQSQTSSGNASGAAATTQLSQPAGVAGAFMQYAGVSGFGNTAAAIGELAKQQGSWLALLYGVITALLFLVAAIVLFYGTFLLISRALVMIFLMITASIAFASYLLPSGWQGNNYGWGMWWQTLFKNAVLAPLLMLFLWVTLTIGSAFKTSTGSLGSLVSNAQSSLDINALLGYVIVIGLLFASFKLSSSFASSIGGFNFGAQFATGTGALFSRFAAAPLGRQIFGRAAMRSSQDKSNKLTEVRDRIGNLNKWDPEFKEKKAALSKEAAELARQKGKADSRARRSYNVMDTGAAKTLTKSLGLTGVLAGQTPKGNEGGLKGAIERRAKEAAKKTDVLAVSKEQQDKIRDQAKEDMKTKLNMEHQSLKEQKEAQVATLKESAHTMGEELKKTREDFAKTNPEYSQAKEAFESLAKDSEKAEANHEQAMKELQSQFTSATDPRQRQLIQTQINESAEAHKSDMRDRAQKIEVATTRARKIAGQNQELAALEDKYERRTRTISDVQTEIKNLSTFTAAENAKINEAGEEAVKNVRGGMEEAAKKLGEQEGSIWTRMAGAVTGGNETTGKLTAEEFRKRRGRGRLKETLKDIAEEDKEEPGTAPPPSPSIPPTH